MGMPGRYSLGWILSRLPLSRYIIRAVDRVQAVDIEKISRLLRLDACIGDPWLHR